MTTLTACPVCATARPTNRPGNEPWCCSLACYRRFHGIDQPSPSSCHDGDQGRRSVVIPAARPEGPITAYECDCCGERGLGDQRCGSCGTFMCRVGIGGCCRSCDEPITVKELVGEEAIDFRDGPEAPPVKEAPVPCESTNLGGGLS